MTNRDPSLHNRFSRRALLRSAGLAGIGALTLGSAAASAQNIIFAPNAPGTYVYDPASLVRASLAAFDAGDLTAFKATVSSDVTYIQEATGLVLHGPDQVAGLAAAFHAAFPDLNEEIINLVVGTNDAGDTYVTAEVVVHGAFKGPLHFGPSTIQPTGKSLNLPDCLVHQVRDGKIVLLRDYFDNGTFATQLGLTLSH